MKLFTILLMIVLALMLSKNGTAQIMDSVKHDNGFLYYHKYGSTELPAVIILTGGPGNSYNQLEELAETISPKFNSIVLEQRGTGRSIPTPFDSSTVNLNTVTKDLEILMDSLKLEKAILLGHSWGGMLAMNFAAEFPERVAQLVLIAPGPHKEVRNGFEVLSANRNHTRSIDENQRLWKLAELANKNEIDSLEFIELKKLARRAYIYANPIPDSLFSKVDAAKNWKTAGLLEKDIIRNYDVSKSLNNYKGKVDVISGRQDVLGYNAYELKHDRPSANLHWINECGHFPMYERPTEFYQILYRILNAE